MAENPKDGARPIGRETVKAQPYNIRLDLARANLLGAITDTQTLCDIDDATMAILLEALAGGLRANLGQAAAMQCALAASKDEDKARLVSVSGGKAAKVKPVD